MKKVVLSLVMLGIGAQAFAQDVLYSAKIKKEELPELIITAIETDYPDYTMEEFSAIPLEYVDSDVYINRDADSVDDYATFEISLQGKGKDLTVTYDREGNRISTMEHAKNVAPDRAVAGAVAKAYPGWTIAKDTYNMTHYTGGNERQRYRLELTKGDEKMHVYTDAKGKILNKPKERKMHMM